jgi:uncharacterized membrane protein YoaK (UPF0700 family)
VSSQQAIASRQKLEVFVHRTQDVLSWRHGSSFLILAMSAGAANAFAFIASQRFVTHVTGVLTRIGLDAGAWTLMGEYALVLASFVVGAMVSVGAIQARIRRGVPPRPDVALTVVAGSMLVVGVLGDLGAFGPMGASVEEADDFVLLALLAFAMGLMNATVASSTEVAVRTTHMTGPATDLGVHLATAWATNGAEREKALRLAALRGGKMIAFCAGAALMVSVVGELGYLALALPA